MIKQSLAVALRGISALGGRSASLTLPAGAVVAVCYILVFDNGQVGSPKWASDLAAGVVTLAVINGAIADNIDSLYSRLHLSRLYVFIREVSPVSIGSIILGDALAASARAAVYIAGSELAIFIALGAHAETLALWGILGILASFALALTSVAVCGALRSLSALSTAKFFLLPLFLTSGAIFPIFPPVGWGLILTVSPFWHISQLMRSVIREDFMGGAVSAAYLIVLGFASYFLALRSVRRLT